MDSDDQSYNKKCDIDDEEDVVVEYKVEAKCCDQIDANGNSVNSKNQSDVDNCAECDCVEVKVDSEVKNTTIREKNDGRKKNDSVMEKIIAMTLTDYGEFHLSLPIRHFEDRRVESD